MKLPSASPASQALAAGSVMPTRSPPSTGRGAAGEQQPKCGEGRSMHIHPFAAFDHHCEAEPRHGHGGCAGLDLEAARSPDRQVGGREEPADDQYEALRPSLAAEQGKQHPGLGERFASAQRSCPTTIDQQEGHDPSRPRSGDRGAPSPCGRSPARGPTPAAPWNGLRSRPRRS